MNDLGASLVPKWLSSSNAEGVGSIPGGGNKIPQTSWPKNQDVKWKQLCIKFNKDF